MADLGNRTNVNAAIDLLLDDAQPNEAIQPSDHNGLLKDILDTLANGLSVTLRTGNTTSGQNIEVTSGDTIDFDNSSFLGSLTSGTLTAARTYTLPDKTGTIAMLSDVENILNTNGLVLTGNYTHDLNSNSLGMFDGSIGLGDDLTVISNDATKTYLANFVSSNSNAVLTLRNIVENVGIGNNLPDSSAKLEISSTDKGLLIPRMSTTQRNAIGSPTESLMIYNTTDDQFEFYDSLGAWSQLGGGGASIYTADGTIGTGRVVTLTDTITFKGIGLTIGQRNLIIRDGNNDYILENFDNGYFKRTIRSGSNLGVISNAGLTQGLWLQTVSELAGAGGLLIKNAKADTNYLKYYTDNFKAPDAQWYSNGQIHHRIRSNGTSSTVLSQASFFINGFYGFGFNVGASAPVGTEDISLQGETLIKGNGTSTGTTLALYDNDTIPTKNVDFLDNGQIRFLNLPTSSAGLSAGDIWNDGGTLKIV
jgi:hypothetical protein